MDSRLGIILLMVWGTCHAAGELTTTVLEGTKAGLQGWSSVNSVTVMNYGQYITATNPSTSCELSIYYHSVESDTGGARGWSYWLRHLPGGEYIRDCWGIPKSGWGSEQEWANAVLQKMVGVQVPRYMGSSGVNPGTVFDLCAVTFLYYNGATRSGRKWSSGTNQCEMKKGPVSCSIESPNVIDHKQRSAGVVRSLISSDLKVRCNAPVSVKLSIDGKLPLSSGGAEINSTMSIGRVGATSVNVYANNTGNTTLISEINTETANVGEYSGATVITANWD